ncbi:MAG: hypothetical protein KAJ95_01795 [Gammaproteobacteria bacterium]|nr:hypothetical protein [Gammaproteobacteria bacterium]
MYPKIKIMALLASLLVFSLPASALEDIVESVANGCDKELSTYCKDVTPGEGRILACLFAHSDKISGRCEYAVYDAAAQLERAVSALTFVANECGDDIENICAKVEAGEGRILTCLKTNEDKVAKRCKQAMKDIDLQLN